MTTATKTKARKAVALVRKYVAWRNKGRADITSFKGTKIGSALDTLCDFAESALAKEKKGKRTP